jgi:hypothetical protein
VTATTADLRSLAQIRWEVRQAAAGLHAVRSAQRAADARRHAGNPRTRADAATWVDAAVAADEWALIADERAGRRAAA